MVDDADASCTREGIARGRLGAGRDGGTAAWQGSEAPAEGNWSMRNDGTQRGGNDGAARWGCDRRLDLRETMRDTPWYSILPGEK